MRRLGSWLRGAWSRLPPAGMLTLAAFVLCAGSGVLLGLVYDPARPQDSIALILLRNPAAVAVRSAHFWSAQFFLVLCLGHAVDHLRRRGRPTLTAGIWLRLTLSLPVVGYAMLSGFILRGDPAAQQAERVFAGLLRSVPWAGDPLAALLVGPGGGIPALYLHHIATATILIWLAAIEHARRILPDRPAVAWTAILLLPPTLLLTPGLGAAPAAVEHAPWYLAGFQELLRWLPHPGAAMLPVVAGLAAIAWLPRAGMKAGGRIRAGLLIAGLLYAVASLVALTRREAVGGEDAFRPLAAGPTATAAAIPPVRGVREGCLACHGGMVGLPPAHDAAAVGCASCHGGDRFSTEAAAAHAGMSLTPGDLSVVVRSCGTSGCHEEIAGRVAGSLMNTMRGVVAVDRWVFGEARDPDQPGDIRRLGHTPADTHLRQLCASCHLGQDKEAPGPLAESSRGGGCSACHLSYDAPAAADLAARGKGRLPTRHPAISLAVPAVACFGCHSRSGRVSTSYEGWAEVAPAAQPAPGAATRLLEDGRTFERRTGDIHHRRGMACIDCHLASEVMGDGVAHAHKEAAVRVACGDCHAAASPPTTPLAGLDPETRTIVALRGFEAPGRRYVRTASGTAYPNVWLDEGGRIAVHRKDAPVVLHPRPPPETCGRNLPGHRAVDCNTCHSSWASQCISCHTAHDPAAEGWDHLARAAVAGAWEESAHDYRTEPPVLGVKGAAGRIVACAPGMIMHLQGADGGDRFRRLYAPVAPHTTVPESRSCVSCHADPLALGYGRGRLEYQVADGRGTWTFTPALAAEADGLPADAWVGFLREPVPGSATRSDLAPLDLARQHRLLLVGTCLQCHQPGESRLGFADWTGWRGRLGPRCALPDWAPR